MIKITPEIMLKSAVNFKGSRAIAFDSEEKRKQDTVFEIIENPIIGLDELLDKPTNTLSHQDQRKLIDAKRYIEANNRIKELQSLSCEEKVEKYYNATKIHKYKTETIYPIDFITLVKDRLNEYDTQIFDIVLAEAKEELNKLAADYIPQITDLSTYPLSEEGKKVIKPYINYIFGVGSFVLNEYERGALIEEMSVRISRNVAFRTASHRPRCR